jgi:lysophospholipase L1-like esterase
VAAKRLLAAVPAIPLAGAAILVGQILYAGYRNDLPSFGNQDPSGRFGSDLLPSLRIVVLGDSSVTGPGVEMLDALWIRRVAAYLSDRYHVDLHSVAVGGSKARDVVNNQLEAALNHRPHLAMVSVGANDALRATPVGRFESEMHMIVGTLHEETDAVAVAGIGDLGGIPRLPALPRTLARLRARAFDAAIERVAADYPRVAKSTTWGPMWEPFSIRDPEVYAPDLFHASGKGHEIFAASAIPVVERLLPLVDAQADAR